MADAWKNAEEPPTEEELEESVFLEFKNSMETVLAELQYVWHRSLDT